MNAYTGVNAGQRIYDAAVVGGGVVGLAAALAIAEARRSVALVAPGPPRRRSGALGSDLRTLALNPASLRFLRAAGLSLQGEGGLEGDGRFARIQTMRVWERDGGASLRFSQPNGDALAWVVEAGSLATALWDAAAQRVEVVTSTVTSVAQGENAAHIRLADGACLDTRLVVAADGAASVVRRETSTEMRTEPPPHRLAPQTAIATVARLDRPHGSVAWQRFGRSGPVALLPLPDDHTVSVIWSGEKAEQERRMALSDAEFRAALEDETEAAAGAILAVDRRAAFAVQQGVAANLNPWPRVVLAGDAARTLHPLAGQGVNIGLEDARGIAAEAAADGDLGAAGRWRAYAARRRRRSKLMVALMRGLLEAYCGGRTNGPWLRWARNATIRRIDASAAVKGQLMREAMGLGALAA